MASGKFVGDLKGVLDETKYGEYLAGSLCLKIKDNLVIFNVNGHGSIMNVKSKAPSKEYIQTPQENYLVCQNYLKYKTPDHCHYELAKKVVESFPLEKRP